MKKEKDKYSEPKTYIYPNAVVKVYSPILTEEERKRRMEHNMVIHAGGGNAEVLVYEDRIEIVLSDHGPGIANVEMAMQEGYSTAPDNIRSLGFGAGMGLPNMKRYTNQMRIETEPGKGTRIFMTVML